MNGGVHVNLIHLALLQHEQMLVKIQISQVFRGGDAEKAKKILGTAIWWLNKYQRYKNKLLPDR
jgi:hypothetical protein